MPRPAGGASPLSPRLRKLIASDRMERPRPGRLAEADVDALVDVVLGRTAADAEVRADLAVRALAAGADATVAARALGAILGDGGAATSARVVAAHELGVLAAPGTTPALVAATTDEEARVRQAAFAALARFAGRDVLDELADVSERDAAAHRHLQLARALIVHRAGLDGPFLPDARPAGNAGVDEGDRTTLVLRRSTEEKGSGPRIEGGTFGVVPAATRYELRCGSNTWTVLVNRELAGDGGEPGRIFERPWIAGLLARWLLEGRTATVQHLVLTRPAGDAVRIEVVRRDGVVMYLGEARAAASGMIFTVEAAEGAPSPPVHVEGSMGAEGISVDRAVVGATRRSVRSGDSVVPS